MLLRSPGPVLLTAALLTFVGPPALARAEELAGPQSGHTSGPPSGPPSGPTATVEVPITWPGYRSRAELYATPEGPRYRVKRSDGSAEVLDPMEFATEAINAERSRLPLERALNVTGWGGVAWVAFGLLGQVIFMGRMVLQWLVSERAKRSVVPPTFWFMSLVGSMMLLAYFVWRWDIVGMLGQGLGSAIYVRNIMLIRRHAQSGDAEAQTA
jgi:lipid-A-disaccharide synthase-like uncharacterized protein